MNVDPIPFRDRSYDLGGVIGQALTIRSANPINHHQAVTDPQGCGPIDLDAQLFVPSGAAAPPATVILVPGSLGVGPNHEQHAATLIRAGFAVCLLDPFGARSVASTVAEQTQYSFAASAFDVLATLRQLAERDDLDPMRIGAQGHSRGGSAVTIAAHRRFADPIIGSDLALAGVFAVYPWCGQQFEDADVRATTYRAIIGDQDEWCSVQQVQAQVHALRQRGAAATIRIVAGAAHSFDRLEEPYTIEEASVAPAAPTVMLADDGAMILPTVGTPDPAVTDRDAFVDAIEAGHGRQGAAIGGVGDQPAIFEADMLAFHRSWS
ncbi:MAG: dienelactone hydrolase family protein [Actinomycetota bacterium]